MPLAPADAFELLWARLAAERPKIDEFNAWYNDEQPHPQVPDECNEGYRRLIEICSENWAGLICDTVADRIRPQGLRFAGNDETPWELWQASGMDAGFDQVVLEACISGRAPLMTVADDASPTGVRITAEDPRQTISVADPVTGIEAAALKTWVELDGTGRIEVMVPGVLLAGRSKQQASTLTFAAPTTWGSLNGWDWDTEAKGPEDVPVTDIHVNARPGRRGTSLLARHVKALRLINLMGFDLALATEFAAYRQRWVTGLELEEDDQGEPKKPFRSGVDHLFVGEDDKIKFGEFAETDLSNLTKTIEHKVAGVLSRARIPQYYWGTGLSNISADTIRALDAGLVALVERLCRGMSDPTERAVRKGLRIIGAPGADDHSAEIIWADPRNHTDGQLADALVKKANIGIPREALWAQSGASPQEIAEWRRMRARDMLLDGQDPAVAPLPADTADAAPAAP